MNKKKESGSQEIKKNQKPKTCVNVIDKEDPQDDKTSCDGDEIEGKQIIKTES